MSDVSGIPYMGPMGQGNFFAPQFSYNPQLTAGAIQSSYMPEASQGQSVLNNLYASGGGFGQQTNYYSGLGAGYSAAGMSPYGIFTDPGYGGGGGGGASPYQTSSNVWDTGASGFGYPGAGGIDWSMFQQQASPYQSSSNVFSGGASPFNYSGAGLDWSNLFQPSQSSQSPFSAGNFGAGMFGGLAGGIGGTYQGQNNSMDWSNLFGGGAAKADPYSGMKMPGGLGSSMATPQQQPADYSSLFGRGVGGAGQDTSSPYEASKPSAGDLGGGMFGGLGGAGATPGAGLDWSKLFGGNEAKTDPAPGMTMPGGLGTPLGREQPADFSSRFGDWGKQPSGVRGEIVPEERNTTSNMYTIPAGGGVFGGGGAESQLYGANAGSLGGDGGLGFNPITGTGPKGDTADSLAEQARARLAELMNDKGDKTIELKAEPGGMIGPPDPREAPDYNPFAGEKIPLPQARPEGADAPRPPAGMPERPGERQAYEAPPRPAVDMALANSPTLRGVNPRLVAAVQGGASFLPPGYTVEAVSGVREGKAQSYHSGGRAADFRIVGPDGPIPHKGEDDTGMYTLLARGVKTWTQQNDPQLAQQMGYGGAFGTQLGGGGVPDLMHYDLGGSRGRMVPDVQFGNLKPLSSAEQNAMPSYIPLLGDNQVPLDRSVRTGPGYSAVPRFGGDAEASAAGQLPPGVKQLPNGDIVASNYWNIPKEGTPQWNQEVYEPMVGSMVMRRGPETIGGASSYDDFRRSSDVEDRRNEQLGRDQLASLKAMSSGTYYGGPEPEGAASNPLSAALGLGNLPQAGSAAGGMARTRGIADDGTEGGNTFGEGDAAQQLTAKYGPEALWAAQGQSQFPQGQTQPLGGNDVSRMPYTQQSPVPGASFPVQLYDDPRYGQAQSPTAEAPSQPFPGASEVTQQPYQPSRFDEGNPFFSPTGGALSSSPTSSPIGSRGSAFGFEPGGFGEGGYGNRFTSSAADIPQTTNLPAGDLTQRLLGDPFNPDNYNTLDQAFDLAAARSPYMDQLNQNPQLMDTLKALAVSEIGRGRSNEQYAAFFESVLNQSAATNRGDLAKFLSGGYYQPINQGTMGPSYQYLRDNPEMSANVGRMLGQAGAGSNVSNLAMENSSYNPKYPELGPGAMQPQYGGFLNMFLPGSNEYLTSKLNPYNDPAATKFIGSGMQPQYRDFWQRMMPAGTEPWIRGQ